MAVKAVVNATSLNVCYCHPNSSKSNIFLNKAGAYPSGASNIVGVTGSYKNYIVILITRKKNNSTNPNGSIT